MKEDIQRSLGNLEGTINEGFKSIVQRLDTMNGSLKTHETQIDSLKIDQAVLKTKAGFISGGISLAIMVAWEFFKERIK